MAVAMRSLVTFQGNAVLFICFCALFFQEMEGQSQGTKGHAALALEAVFQKTVAQKNFCQPFWEV